ncbi:MAG UNVERIFIED_CONTAM: hypothetical protein LVT10_14905 [Anaerolineae bacterium]
MTKWDQRGKCWWFLKQLEPKGAVQRQPDMLAYQPIPYDRTSLFSCGTAT